MEKTEIHIAVEPIIKEEADDILKRLGITITDAVIIFLNQIILNDGLPFNIKLPVPNEKF
ncbi:MAG: type II toxin-antitoxin system RelB/DinJ family antitoxin [Oscillospiraceae bacterium]|nr:type II toxin-antitoxin system RelB/DinJ family antitoxin [Oscillospiraceae bacterium]